MKSKIKLWTVEELSKPLSKEQKKTFKTLESAYRRGYRHGYSASIDAHCEIGAMIGEIHYFFDKFIVPWGYFKDKLSQKSNMVTPPEFDFKRYSNREYEEAKGGRY